MDEKNIKGNDEKLWPKPYDRPKDEGAYESAPKYEKDNDEILFWKNDGRWWTRDKVEATHHGSNAVVVVGWSPAAIDLLVVVEDSVVFLVQQHG